jgi:hypothetical protein
MMYGSRGNFPPADPATATQVDANDAFDMGIQFEQRDDLPAAEAAYRTADQLGHATAALNLGVLLEERDDFDGAEQAFRRADERGDATAAFHLAWMLQEGGDLSGAEEAYRRAEMRGHPGAHANLRMLLDERGGGDAAPNRSNGTALAVDEAPPSAPAPVDVPPAVVEHEPIAEHEPVAEHEPPAEHEPVAEHEPPAEHEPAGPEVDDAAADALAAAVATSAIAGEPPFVDPAGADLLAAELSQRAAAPRHVPAGRTRGRAPRPPASRRDRAGRGRSGRHAATPVPDEAEAKPSRARGLLRRTLGFGLPVAAFAAAFILGVASRPHNAPPPHLATASSRTAASATVTKVSPVPSPAKLVVVRHRAAHRSKPKTVHGTAAATHAVTPVTPAASAPVTSSQAAAPAHSSPAPSPGSGGSSVSTNGTGTASGSG